MCIMNTQWPEWHHTQTTCSYIRSSHNPHPQRNKTKAVMCWLCVPLRTSSLSYWTLYTPCRANCHWVTHQPASFINLCRVSNFLNSIQNVKTQEQTGLRQRSARLIIFNDSIICADSSPPLHNKAFLVPFNPSPLSASMHNPVLF